MNSLLAEFIIEARDLLESSNAHLLALEKKPDDAEAINICFRAMHTLKGDSGLVDLPEITRLLHAAEDVLDGVRGKTLTLGAETIDLLLQVTDCVSGWLDRLEGAGQMPSSATADSAPLISRLRAMLTAGETRDGV
jgi:two-component system chemotaxis sensor kinase CheA